MSEHRPPALEGAQIVYRAIRSKSWVDRATNRLKPDAYIRRSRESMADQMGLSVSTVSAVHSQERLATKHGAASLEVGGVRALPFELDVEPNTPTHANITGVPFPEDHQLAAEHIARRLRDISTYPAE